MRRSIYLRERVAVYRADEASNEARHNYLDVHFVRVTHSSPFLMYLNMSPVLVEVL